MGLTGDAKKSFNIRRESFQREKHERRDPTASYRYHTVPSYSIISPLATANVLPMLCGLAFSVLLVPGKKYPQTGIKKIYGKTSVRVRALIQNEPPLFAGTSCLGQVAKAENHGTELRKTKKCQEVLVTAVL